jgi:hypothetical protein
MLMVQGRSHLSLSGRLIAAAILPLALLGAPQAGAQWSGRAPLFERLAGAWVGVGSAAVEGARPERIRCRADYRPSGPSQLRLRLRCASDSFNLDIESEITREGDRIVGSWSEAGAGVSGEVRGAVGADGMRAVVTGLGLSGQLSMMLRGDVQAISLSTRGQFSASAAVTLRRA